MISKVVFTCIFFGGHVKRSCFYYSSLFVSYPSALIRIGFARPILRIFIKFDMRVKIAEYSTYQTEKQQ